MFGDTMGQCRVGHCFLFFLILFLDKVIDLVGGGAVINGAYPN